MERALALAESALYLTSPNPRVGCVLVGANGLVLGEGHTQKYGEAHAEVMALRAAREAGHDVRGATAYLQRWCPVRCQWITLRSQSSIY